MDHSFSQGILKVLKNLNKVTLQGAFERGCQPFFVENRQVGLIRPDFWEIMKEYKDVFYFVDSKSKSLNDKKPGVHLSSDFKTYNERSSAVNGMLEDIRKKDLNPALRGWRHENYKVNQKYTDEPYMEVERAASGMFGFIQYGVHINGYTVHKNGDLMMWIGRRSKTKPTFPDMYDNMCAGGLAADLGVLECAKKECQEEASVADDILEKLKFVGNISYFYEDERGLFPECQFVFDLELPHDFQPVNADGEVSSFHLFSMKEIKLELVKDSCTPTTCGIILDFLIRHGYLSPDEDPNISYYMEQLHAPLQTYYAGK